MYDDEEVDAEDPVVQEPRRSEPAAPRGLGPVGVGALQGLFPPTEMPEIPKSPVDPSRKWRAWGANVLKGSTLAEGMSRATGAYVDQENKDSELYQRYLPLAMDAKQKRQMAVLQQQQIQQKMLQQWNTALLANTAPLLNQPGPIYPQTLMQVVSGAVQSGQVPPQVAQGWIQQMPQDPVALRAYLERAVLSAHDPYRAVKAPTLKTVKPEEDLVSVPAGGGAPTVLATGQPKKDAFVKMMEAAGIPADSPEGRQFMMNYLKKQSTHAPAASQMVVMKEEGEEAKTVGKFYGDQFASLQKDGLEAQNKLAALQRMRQLMQGWSSGKLTPVLKDIAGYAAEFGIKLDPNLGPKEAFESLSNEMAMQARNPSGGAGMPGAMSDADREFLKNTVPNLAKSPQGNLLIMETQRRLAQRTIDVAKFAAEYRRRNGKMDTNFQTELLSWANEHPLFADLSPKGRTTPKGATNVDDLVRRAKAAQQGGQ